MTRYTPNAIRQSSKRQRADRCVVGLRVACALALLALGGCPLTTDNVTDPIVSAEIQPGVYRGQETCIVRIHGAFAPIEQTQLLPVVVEIGDGGALSVGGIRIERGTIVPADAGGVSVRQSIQDVTTETAGIRVKYVSTIDLTFAGQPVALVGEGSYLITGRDDGTLVYSETAGFTYASVGGVLTADLSCSAELVRDSP